MAYARAHANKRTCVVAHVHDGVHSAIRTVLQHISHRVVVAGNERHVNLQHVRG